MLDLRALLSLPLLTLPLLIGGCSESYELDTLAAECGPCVSGELDGDSVFTPVNRDQGLRSDWEADDLELLGAPYTTFEHRSLREAAADAFRRMSDAGFTAKGQRATAGSTYRSFSTQCTLFDNYANGNGCEQANTFSARAGHSEHQLGTTVDIMANGSWLDGGAAIDGWLEDNAHNFGFVMSYPPGTTPLTGYIHEPWHFRWIGVPAATRLHERSIAENRHISTHEFIDSLSEDDKVLLDPSGEIFPETPTEGRGAPRVQYARTYVLLNGADTGEAEALAAIDRFWSSHWTLGFSADDAGIGDLESRHVIAIRPSSYPTSLISFFANFYGGLQYSPVASLSAPLPSDSLAIGVEPAVGRGQPRVQYARTYVLLHPSFSVEWPRAAMRAGFARGERFTIGASPDDAGIGNLDSRHVIVVNPSMWTDGTGKTIQQFFQQEYPGVTIETVNANSAEQLRFAL